MGAYDADQVERELRKVMDGRSLRECCQEAGVSNSYLSKLLAGEYHLTPKSIKKLSKLAADPATFERILLDAAGVIELSEYEYASSGAGERNMSDTRRSRLYEMDMAQIVKDHLITDGLYEVAENRFSSVRGIRCDKCLSVDNGLEWLIKAVYIAQTAPENGMEMLYRRVFEQGILLQLVKTPPDRDRKFTVATNSDVLFHKMLMNCERLSYKGNLNIMLVDLENYRVINDKDICFYAGKD